MTYIAIGTCSLTAHVAAGTNYNAADGSAQTFTVSVKATSTVTVTCTAGAPFTYTGSAQTPCTAEATGAGMSPVDVTASLVYSGNTNAGAATADASWAGDADHGPGTGSGGFTIGKATSTTVVTCPASVGYTGSAQTPCTVTVTGAGGLSLTPTPTYSANTAVGTATAAYSYAGDANHGASSDSKTFEILGSGSTTVVTFEPGPYTYRGTAFTATAVVTGTGGLNQPVPVVLSGDCVNVTTADGCTATATFAGDANHSGSTDSKSITIAKADAVCTVTGYTGTYDGAAHGASGSCLGVAGPVPAGGVAAAAPPAVPLAGLDLGASFTNAPGGTATWTFTDVTGNYDNASGTVAIAIGKVSLTVTPDAKSRTYGQAIPTYTFSVTGFVNGETTGTAAGYVAPSCTSGYTTSTPVAGSPLTITCSGGSATNYAFDTSATAQLTIARADAACAVSGVSVTYDGAAHGATGACTGVRGETLTGLDLGASFTDVPGGTADWTLGNPNYNVDEGSVDIDIAAAAQAIEFPALPDVTFGAAGFVLDATTDSGLPISYSSLTPGVCTVSGTTVTIVGVGTCTIEASQAGDDNHAPAAPVTRSFVVLGADSSTPETSTGSPLAIVGGSGALPLALLGGLMAVGALATLLLLLGLRARRRDTGR